MASGDLPKIRRVIRFDEVRQFVHQHGVHHPLGAGP